MKKRFLKGACVALSLSVLLCGSTFPAGAAEYEVEGLTVTEYEQIEPVDVSNATIIDLPEVATFSSEPEGEDVFTDLEAATSVAGVESSTEGINLNARSGNQEFNFTGTIAQEGGMYAIYPITLYTNQNIHAELVGPQNTNLNYSLALYEMDVNTGDLTTLVDSCTYARASGISQTIATRNKTTAGKDYALIVLSRSGSSSTETFDVNITLGIGGDGGESNDNAYTAYSTGALTKSGLVVNETTLDSPLDVDWFVFTASDFTDFTKIKILNNTASNVTYQLYYASGSTMVENVPVNGVYRLSKGTNYLRVKNNGNDFSAGDVSYGTSISVVFNPARIASEIQMDKYDHLPAQTYGIPGGPTGDDLIAEKRYAVIGGSTLSWKGTYISASGYLCTDAKDTLSIEMTNTAWNAGNPDMCYVSNSGTAKNGVATVSVKSLQSFGQINKPVGEYSHIWADWDCTLTMQSSTFGSLFEGGYKQPIYITSKIF